MTDIFREIEDDIRRDRLAGVWARYGIVFIALAVLAVVGVAGWRYWDYTRGTRAAADGARFESALALARDGKGPEAEKALEAIAADAGAGYRMLARFRLASEVARRDPEAGAQAFEAIAADTNLGATLQDFARIRAATLRVDRADPKEMAAKIEGLASQPGPWRNAARELLGLSALKAGDYEGAGRWFDQIVVDAETPTGLRQRVQLYLELVRAGPVTPAPTQ